MTSEGLGEMFESDSADTCANKFPLLSMGDRAEGLACAYPVVRKTLEPNGIQPGQFWPEQFFLCVKLTTWNFQVGFTLVRKYANARDQLRRLWSHIPNSTTNKNSNTKKWTINKNQKAYSLAQVIWAILSLCKLTDLNFPGGFTR